MMRPRTIKVVAIALVLIVALTTKLGYQATSERQNIPPKYSPFALDF
jgi:hypothetical protein